MKARKPMIKAYSKPKKSYSRVPSGDKRVLSDPKTSAFGHEKPAVATSGCSKITSIPGDQKLLSFTHVPLYFNSKKSKSRKRNLNSKTTYSDKKAKNLSNSDKKLKNKVSKAISFFNSVLSESTPREEGFSPNKVNLLFYL